LPPANADKPASAVASGLAAAFTDDSHRAPATSLGALDEMQLLSLSSLDGSDHRDAPPASFEPPAAAMMPASIGPAIRTSAPSAASTTAPIDRFAAPQAEEEFVVDLATDEIEYRERRRGSISPATHDANAASAGTRAANSSIVATTARSGAIPTGTTMGANATTLLREPPRWRHAAGVLLAVMLGFAPAHLVAAMREETKFAQIDKAVIAKQAAATTPEAYAALDGFRAEQVDRKTSERRMIALMALGIWAAAAGLIAFVWFRLVPWDRR
jgi:hypothetical protein